MVGGPVDGEELEVPHDCRRVRVPRLVREPWSEMAHIEHLHYVRDPQDPTCMRLDLTGADPPV